MSIMRARMAVHNQRRWSIPLHLCVTTVPTLLSHIMIAACHSLSPFLIPFASYPCLSMFLYSLSCLFHVQAPGTFGYDHSKYRRPPNDSESIPMDEFGRPSDQDENEKRQQLPNEVLPTMHEEPPGTKPKQPPSPRYPPPDVQVVAPFVDMVPQQPQSPEKEEMDEVSSGCCRCVIM